MYHVVQLGSSNISTGTYFGGRPERPPQSEPEAERSPTTHLAAEPTAGGVRLPLFLCNLDF